MQFRLQNRDLGMVMREVDEDLAIFLGMKERNQHFIIENSDEFDESMSKRTAFFISILSILCSF